MTDTIASVLAEMEAVLTSPAIAGVVSVRQGFSIADLIEGPNGEPRAVFAPAVGLLAVEEKAAELLDISTGETAYVASIQVSVAGGDPRGAAFLRPVLGVIREEIRSRMHFLESTTFPGARFHLDRWSEQAVAIPSLAALVLTFNLDTYH